MLHDKLFYTLVDANGQLMTKNPFKGYRQMYIRRNDLERALSNAKLYAWRSSEQSWCGEEYKKFYRYLCGCRIVTVKLDQQEA